MNTNIKNTQNKNNKTLIIIILVAVAVIVLAAVGFIVFKSVKNANQDTSANATLIKCNTGKTVTEADLKDLEELCKGKIGDKFIKAEKRPGVEPVTGFPTNANGDELSADIGDAITLTFKLLTEEERSDIYLLIANKFDFIHDYGMDFENAVYQINISEIYRADLK